MAYRKSTLRSMSPTTRKVARLIGEQESVARRFKNLVLDIQRLELDSRALATAKQQPSINYQAVMRHLATIQGVSIVTYTEIHNVDAINHTLNLINSHALEALELIKQS